jgi:enterobactin synthetase component D
VDRAGSFLSHFPRPHALLPDMPFRLNLPIGIEVVALDLPSPEQTLSLLSVEVAGAPSGATPRRRAQFAAGRHAAFLALARYGCLDAVRRRPNGAPGWPGGFVGSISHSESLAVAAVAQSSAYRGIGLDVEEIVSSELQANLAPRILTSDESDLLRTALPSVEPRVWVSLGFSAKESLYKCLNPLSGDFFGFFDARLIHVALTAVDSGELVLCLTRTLSGGFTAGLALRGQFTLDESRVSTAFVLQSEHADARSPRRPNSIRAKPVHDG